MTLISILQMDFPVSVTLIALVSILLTLPLSSTAQPYRNVSLNSFLVADDSNSTWISPSGDFAFGFRQVSPRRYLLAIMFNEIPEKTIVWSANRNEPVERGSRAQLSADEGLVLRSPTGQQIWASSLGVSNVAYGAMLDTGNFVLGNNSGVVWQSFDEPTDTLLPGQVLNQDRSLLASISETNYSRGRFRFIMQTDGNFAMYAINTLMETHSDPYHWTTNLPGFQVIFNQSGYLYLSARNGTILYSFFSNETQASTRQFYQRVTVDYDGVLRHYVHPRSASNRSTMSWSFRGFEPRDICLLITRDTAGGTCRLNSLCVMGSDQRPICRCPNRYSLMDPEDRMSGCKPDFIRQSCDLDSSDVENFDFNDVPNADWFTLEYDYFGSVTEEWCRHSCLVDCLCRVAVFRNGECWKKGSPLRNGRITPGMGGIAMIKFRARNNTGDTSPSDHNPKSNKRSRNMVSAVIITGSVLLGGSVFLNLGMLFALRFKQKKSKINHDSSLLLVGVNIRSFSFNELREATNEFNEELGKGACSKVYKGVLKDSNGKIVAVKKLDKIEREAELEFKAEVNSISMTNHRNLVRLLGYCDEGNNKLLVYEYMQNGSLADFLFEKSSTRPKPNWHVRVQIAFSIARGLCYLHEECSAQIIHCDIKPHNVLLDECHMAKISDFGLAKLLKADQTKTMTAVRGTRGYVAPEWFMNLPITSKVDIYSFGILLLELLCCRRSYEKDAEDESKMILADWAYDCYKEGMLSALVANDPEALDDIRLFEKFVITSIWCVQEDPALRPQMKRVLQMLEGSVEVPAAPNPASFIN